MNNLTVRPPVSMTRTWKPLIGCFTISMCIGTRQGMLLLKGDGDLHGGFPLSGRMSRSLTLHLIGGAYLLY
jgi:hypothetical protein